jgi:membrane protein CcdC involved in cytochrome C biogenesis
MNIKQKIAVAVINILILAELCISMYFGAKNPDNLTSVFFKLFFGMLIPTLIISRFIVKRLKSDESEKNIEVEP